MNGYHHTQRAPLCLLLYFLSMVFLTLAWQLGAVPVVAWIFPLVGSLMLVLAASFHYLRISDAGDRLDVRFGPLPLFRRSVLYEEITRVEIGQTTWLEGWGIHMSIRGGWVWNLWGWDCVVLRLRTGTLRLGTDDAEGLACFLETRIAPASTPLPVHRD